MNSSLFMRVCRQKIKLWYQVAQSILKEENKTCSKTLKIDVILKRKNIVKCYIVIKILYCETAVVIIISKERQNNENNAQMKSMK